MKVISKPRGRGKTEDLVRWILKAPGRRIGLFCSEREVVRVVSEYGRDGLNTHNCVSSVDRLIGLPHGTEVGIDEVDSLLCKLLGGYPCGLATLTEDSRGDK